MMAAKSNMGGVKPSHDLTMGPALSSASALGYLRTASLPHVPTHLSLVPGSSQQTETPATANPRESMHLITVARIGIGCDRGWVA